MSIEHTPAKYSGVVHLGSTYQAPDGQKVTPTGFAMLGIVAMMRDHDGRDTTVTISRRSFASYKRIATR